MLGRDTRLKAERRHLSAPAAMLLAPFLVSAFVDVPRRVEVIPFVTVMGMLAIVDLGIVSIGVIACRRHSIRLVLLVTPYLAFLLWAAVRTAWGGASAGADQNAVVYVLFGACVMLAATVTAKEPREGFAVIGCGIRCLDVVALPLTYVSFFLFRGVEYAWFVGPRAVAVAALTAISWHLARWFHGHRGSGALAALWVVGVLLTLSRTATAVAIILTGIVLIVHLRFAPRRFVTRMVLVGLGAAVVALLTAASGAEVRDRFVTAQFNVVEIAGFRVSTSGRSNLWPAIIESAQKSPIVGHGIASSQAVSRAVGGYLGHPHNDYLRVWHDLGYVGIVLLLTAFLVWFRTLWRAVRSAAIHHTPMEQAVLPLAGILALGALVLAAFTDNVLVYSFVMAPMGILIGAGLAQRLVTPSRRGVVTRTRHLPPVSLQSMRS